MKQEEIELLIKDISARLTCGLKCKVKNRIGTFFITDLYGEGKGIGGYFIEENRSFVYPTIKVMPYLRRLSNMTEDEKVELRKNAIAIAYNYKNEIIGLQHNTFEQMNVCCNWLNSHHFDYRGLIEKGLALEAPEDMYSELKRE